MYNYTCWHCKKSFVHQNKNRQCCSESCSGQYKRYHGPLFVWKDGYCYMLAPVGHPRTNRVGRVRRATLIVEHLIGRHLSVGELVHHKDGEKWHDVPENLQLMLRGEHSRLHGAGRKHTMESRAKMSASAIRRRRVR